MSFASAIFRCRLPVRAVCLVAIVLVFAALSATSVRAQADAAADAVAEIDRVLAKREAKWQCAPLAKTATATAPRAPRGTYYQLRCRRRELIVVALIFFAESEQDATRRLERSLTDPQVFQGAPMPLAGLGEQAYEQRRSGAASVAFRRGPLFAQINVGVAPSENPAPRDKLEKATSEAAKTARRFAAHLTGAKAAK
jgi:hypothetical protein